MAKLKSSGLRNYVGRLGGSVYYMLKGQNIAREKAPEVSNPRTATQMRQRMKWANLVAMYKCLQPYLGKKAFQNKPANWSDYNAFMSANLGSTPVCLTKEAVQYGVSYLAPYKVTEGSLPAISYTHIQDSDHYETDIVLGAEINLDTTISQFSKLILDNNTGWQNGDQLGVIVMQNGRLHIPYTQAFEVILDLSDERTIKDIIPTSDLFLVNTENGKLAVDATVLENPTQGLAYAVAVIHSRTISGKTSVSTQSLVLNANAMNEYRAHITEDAFNAARESYGIPTEVWLDAGYQGETAETAELALASIAEEVTTDKDPKIELMTAGSQNKFFDPINAGDVIGDCYIILRFNKPHGLNPRGAVDLTYDIAGAEAQNVRQTAAPSIAANYVRLKVSSDAFSGIIGKAITFHLKANDATYDLSLTA